MGRKAAVIFDVDGTLADCTHRLHYVQRQKKDWDRFFAACDEDVPREEIVRLAQELANGNAILIASGRPERLRKTTESWLTRYKIPFERIYLRGDSDRRADGTVKSEMIKQMHHHGFQPWLAIDDRETAVQGWRALGLMCLQCDESRY